MPDPLGRKQMRGIMRGLMANKAGLFKVTNSLFKQFHLFLAVRIINTLMALSRGCTRFHFTVSVRRWNYTPNHRHTHTPELAKIWNTVNTYACSPSLVIQCCCDLWLAQTQTVFWFQGLDPAKDPCHKIKCGHHKVCVSQDYKTATCVSQRRVR